jgi:hypothetical protein
MLRLLYLLMSVFGVSSSGRTSDAGSGYDPDG